MKNNPFDEIKKNLKTHYDWWVLRSFAGGPTFRMFDKFSRVQFFLKKHGSALTGSRTQAEHDRVTLDLVHMFRHSGSGIKASGKGGRRPSFGYAVKVLNLYVKHYAFTMACFMGEAKARKLLSRAHVPLDRIVLECVWKDFSSQLRSIPELKRLRRFPKVNALTEKEYCAIQELLRSEAHKAGLPPIAYDFKWAGEPK